MLKLEVRSDEVRSPSRASIIQLERDFWCHCIILGNNREPINRVDIVLKKSDFAPEN